MRGSNMFRSHQAPPSLLELYIIYYLKLLLPCADYFETIIVDYHQKMHQATLKNRQTNQIRQQARFMHSSKQPFRGLDFSVERSSSQKANLLMNPCTITDPVGGFSHQGQNFASEKHENLFMHA